jgi:hypothetical protein
MKFNIKLLQMVKQAILEHPLNTNMEQWVVHNRPSAPCGTVGCIAGWTIANADIKKLRRLKEPVSEMARVRFQNRAQKLLGLTKSQASRLFYKDDWPANLRSQYVNTLDKTEEAKVIAKRIDRFIEEMKENRA